jgi:hypothetical protein
MPFPVNADHQRREEALLLAETALEGEIGHQEKLDGILSLTILFP